MNKEADQPKGPDSQEQELPKIGKEKLQEILAQHKRWVESKRKEGARAALGEANLQKADLRGANLQDADLSRANLQKAYMIRANLRGADLRWASLKRANLLEANLREAKLQGANLREARLIEADLRQANLHGADLRLANLQGADLSGAIELTQEQLDWACGDAETKLPPGMFIKPCPEESN